MDRVLTLVEVAELTRLPLATLRYYRQAGIGPRTFRLGSRVVALESDVRQWIADQRQQTSSGGSGTQQRKT